MQLNVQYTSKSDYIAGEDNNVAMIEGEPHLIPKSITKLLYALLAVWICVGYSAVQIYKPTKQLILFNIWY